MHIVPHVTIGLEDSTGEEIVSVPIVSLKAREGIYFETTVVQ